MCNECNNPFADLEDTEYWDNVDTTISKDDGEANVTLYEENCSKCGGTGIYRSPSRFGSTCFKCKGKGKFVFKTSPEVRKHARQKARDRKVAKAAADRETFIASLDEDVREWLVSNEGSNSFAADLIVKGAKYRGLTEGQINAVRKCIARDADKAAGAAEWIENHEAEHAWLVRESKNGNEFAGDLLNGQYGLMKRGFLSEGQLRAVQKNLDKEKEFAPSDIDISSLKGYYAVPNGDTRLKLCVRRPGKNSRYHGWTFVDDGAAYGSRQTYGKQAPEGTYQGKVQDALRAILENPLEAQKAYGKLTGTCGYCGRILEDPESVAAGIGPICAGKYG